MAKRYNVEDVLAMLDNGNESEKEELASDSDDDEDYQPGPGEPSSDDATDTDSESHACDTEDTTSPADLPPVKHKKLPPATERQGQYTWKKVDYEPPESGFTGEQPEVPLDVGSPLEYFKTLIDDDMLELLASKTNTYAVQKSGRELNTNKKELEQVIGMFLKMGLAPMAGTRMFWETDTRYPQVADIMSRNRFQNIIAHLHFVDNMVVTEEDKTDKLWKIRPWLTMFRNNCLKLVPEEYNSIDEQMVPFKGKYSGVKQYMHSKPHKWGFKIWCRCGISGLLYDFEIYQGSGVKEAGVGLGMSGDVVSRLCSTLPDEKNYKVTADNFFTSMPLIVKLKERGILYLGTARTNRLKNCRLKDEKDLKKEGRGSFDYRVETTHGVSAVKWYDNRAVLLVSSYLGPEPTDSVRRWDKAKKDFTLVTRPNVVKVYNSLMGGVDFLDCLISKYRYPMKARRWYIYLFWHTVTTALVQAWLLYRRHCSALAMPKKDIMKHRNFQAALATALIMTNVLVAQRGRPTGEVATVYSPRASRVDQPDDVRHDNVGHLPVKVGNRGRCKVCKNGFTDTSCVKCNVRLCFNEKRNCFMAYHVK
ncbi:piggyBac transposable element-derived protein 2-like [Periophthalmus magnuspinnatus]|uniref:piggyBac transposable element-derived protein 2-like n=1 Tax=Periophthalmus magnuspinnatus TaxID=409849 RepID=UPI00145AB812|nr:piggyBac transposable element-derived protein 2-like [Periophthalmus magnuspinnatus]